MCYRIHGIRIVTYVRLFLSCLAEVAVLRRLFYSVANGHSGPPGECYHFYARQAMYV